MRIPTRRKSRRFICGTETPRGRYKYHEMKLANSRWGTNARTITTTALALCYSTAEYAAPVWETSAHAHLLNPESNKACRAITGCLKTTNVDNLYLLAGIAPPEIRRSVCARVERTKQVKREILFGHTPARSRLKSRRSFLTSVQPVHEWKRRLEEKAYAGLVNLYEDLATGDDSPWLNWRCLNRLRTGYTCSKEQRKKWDMSTETQNVNAGWQQRARLTCCNAHSSHTPTLWTTFKSSTIQLKHAQTDGRK